MKIRWKLRNLWPLKWKHLCVTRKFHFKVRVTCKSFFLFLCYLNLEKHTNSSIQPFLKKEGHSFVYRYFGIVNCSFVMKLKQDRKVQYLVGLLRSTMFSRSWDSSTAFLQRTCSQFDMHLFSRISSVIYFKILSKCAGYLKENFLSKTFPNGSFQIQRFFQKYYK